MEYSKVTETQIKVIETSAPATKETIYDIDFLIQQRKDIQAQKDRDNVLRDAELKKVRDILDGCVELNIISKEPVKEA